MTHSVLIRPIKKKDNSETAKMIRTVLAEQNAPKTGTAFQDSALDDLFAAYSKYRAIYYVLEENDEIIGGAGIQAIENDQNICELQKMYFLPEARGKGLGRKMIDKCLDFARKHHYKSCYIETLPSMKAAQNLYLKKDFRYINERMGDTGHYACTVWMLKHF